MVGKVKAVRVKARNAKEDKVNHEMVMSTAQEATMVWLIKAGKIRHPRQFDVTKTFGEYDLTTTELSRLSKTLQTAIHRSTGRKLALPGNFYKRFLSTAQRFQASVAE
jgi:hypothetical protein